MSVSITAQIAKQLDAPNPTRYPIGNYIIKCDNNCYYSVDGGSMWYQLKTNVQGEVTNSQLMISVDKGSGNVTVEQVAPQTKLINS